MDWHKKYILNDYESLEILTICKLQMFPQSLIMILTLTINLAAFLRLTLISPSTFVSKQHQNRCQKSYKGKVNITQEMNHEHQIKNLP
jgi:hypothetical protein